MTKKEYVEEVRPILRLGLAFVLYLRFGDISGTRTPEQMFPFAELFVNEFESQFKFYKS